MKKFFILIIIIISLCGCKNINNKNIEDLMADLSVSNNKGINQYRTGYKYYLPSNLSSISSKGLNEVLFNGKDKYYLYVDLVSYYEKNDFEYKESQEVYYSKILSNNDKKGILEINVKNDKYLIEIIYNYAKIEVIVDEDNINEAIINSFVVLSSIEYQDDIIQNIMGEDILNYSEEKFNIFETVTKDSNFLEYIQEYDNYEGSIDIPDYDLIN